MVPQAMTGQIAPPPAEEIELSGRRRKRGREGRELRLEHSFKNIFMGIAFLIVAIALSRSIGQGWWFWMLIPAFSMMGTGIAQYIRLKEREKQGFVAPPPVNRSYVEPGRASNELKPPVASVTEGTTRHLGVEAPTRHLDHEPK